MEKINIAELLKDCPKGMELYSPLCGECYFDRLHMGTIICKKQNTQEITFTSEGYYMIPVFDDCECLLFPSKENRDWSKFQKPFKDGDIVCCGDFIAIFKRWSNEIIVRTYVATNFHGDSTIDIEIAFFGESIRRETRLATEEEKEQLFQAIEDNGYKWNPESKTLEQLKNKFDITTLKPFDKVLVRDSAEKYWGINLFGFYNEITKQFHCMGNTGIGWNECIPYEVNQHLLGTTDDCDEFYKNW